MRITEISPLFALSPSIQSLALGMATGMVTGALLCRALTRRSNTDSATTKTTATTTTIKSITATKRNATTTAASTAFALSKQLLLNGRVIVVTGGASGIGREIALQCATAGAHVVVLDPRETPLEGGPSVTEAWSALQQQKQKQKQNNDGRLASRSGGSTRSGKGNDDERDANGDDCVGGGGGGGTVELVRGKTTVAADCEAAVTACVSRWGRLDVWVNNAAIGGGHGNVFQQQVDDVTAEEDEAAFSRVLAVGATGYMLGARAAIRQFLRQRKEAEQGQGQGQGQQQGQEICGRVINIGSQHGIVACPGDLAYGVAKAAAIYMTRQLANEYARWGIVTNCVSPGKIVTGFDSDVREYSRARTPCPRLGRPNDVAGAVIFLASDLASAFITGANIMVDGGWTSF